MAMMQIIIREKGAVAMRDRLKDVITAQRRLTFVLRAPTLADWDAVLPQMAKDGLSLLTVGGCRGWLRDAERKRRATPTR